MHLGMMDHPEVKCSGVIRVPHSDVQVRTASNRTTNNETRNEKIFIEQILIDNIIHPIFISISSLKFIKLIHYDNV